MLYTLHLHNAVCQLYFNKSGRKEKKNEEKFKKSNQIKIFTPKKKTTN